MLRRDLLVLVPRSNSVSARTREPRAAEGSPPKAASRGGHPPARPPVAFPGRPSRAGTRRRSAAPELGSAPRAGWRAGSRRGTAGAGGGRSHPRARRSALGPRPAALLRLHCLRSLSGPRVGSQHPGDREGEPPGYPGSAEAGAYPRGTHSFCAGGLAWAPPPGGAHAFFRECICLPLAPAAPGGKGGPGHWVGPALIARGFQTRPVPTRAHLESAAWVGPAVSVQPGLRPGGGSGASAAEGISCGLHHGAASKVRRGGPRAGRVDDQMSQTQADIVFWEKNTARPQFPLKSFINKQGLNY